LMLLERPGEVTKREDLQKRLWPTDTFGDFDRGLNRAINRLRVALGDDADNPRFLDTASYCPLVHENCSNSAGC